MIIQNTIPIAFAFDNNLVMPACVCLSSLMMNAKPDTFYDIFILHSEKEELHKEELNQLPKHYPNCRIQYRTVGDLFDNAFEIRGITTPAYYRLLIPELIPEYDKIIYSDVDVIFREDLKQFYNIDLGTNYLGAVDVGVAFRHTIRQYVTNTLGLNPQYGYFYSGNLIINSKQIREDSLMEQFKKLAHNAYKYQDMDILNIACNTRILPLSPSFCLSNYLLECIYTRHAEMLNYYTEEELAHTVQSGIIHYNGMKPWSGWCYNQDIWWTYYRNSIVYNEHFCFEFYERQLLIVERWPLWKRIKHVFRYFKN